MKELSAIKIEQVNGAGFFGDVGTLIGSAVGTGIDTLSAIAGVNPDAKTVVGTIGKGIGLAVDALISSGLQIISKL
ncbi:hypothetical protein [Serratia nevei]|uniref:hypothetical protein n=1 Tax=Serratia nevei TaxID=2703794 RepID=UPI003FA71502